MARTDYLQTSLDSLRSEGLYNTIKTIDSPQGAWLEIDGAKVLNFCSNNYLGLANAPRIVDAAHAALDKFGVGPGAVRSIAGTTSLHVALEEALAEFKGVEAAISFQSGFTANLGVIAALVGAGDTIISDELNHASIVDGVRLSKATRAIYRHGNVDDLDGKLAKARAMGTNKILVITDGVFSMDGDLAPLPGIVEAADRHDAMVMVDDAHGEGVLGYGGRGIANHFGLDGVIDIEVGTMSKAFGVMGGYVAGSSVLVEWLAQRARPFLFSSAVTPPDAAACLAAVEVLSESTELVDRLWANAALFKEQMSAAGFDLGVSETPITPVMLGDEKVARELSRRLLAEESVFAQAISYPTVALGRARIRVMISAAHSPEDLSVGADAFARLGREMGII